MKFKITTTSPGAYRCDMVVHCVGQGEEEAPECGDPAVQPVIDRAFASGDFSGKAGQSLLFYPESGPESGGPKQPGRRLVIGLGKELDQWESYRAAGGSIAAAVLKTKARRVLVALAGEAPLPLAERLECLTVGLALGAYSFHKYQTKEDPEAPPGRLDEVAYWLGGKKGGSVVRRGLEQGRLAAEGACFARDMANEPGNRWTPSSFAEVAKGLAEKHGLRCRILDKAAMRRQGLVGILAVNQGSAEPPALVCLEYRTGRKVPTLLLVGKGLTFDAGGISLKPPAGMEDMKYDMCGGAAVLGVMQAVAAERPTGLDVVALVPATENLPGPAALKPGDVITQYGGKTVEVINTDAEGRLILADALAWGIKRYKPAAVVDIATLTGAVIIGLGHHRTGLLGTDEALIERLKAAGERSGEPVWQLPLAPEYAKQLKSRVADIKNIDKRDAGTILGAAFLAEFVGDTPWCHLDIAGTAWNFTEKSYVPKGPSGVGVRLLLELVRSWG